METCLGLVEAAQVDSVAGSNSGHGGGLSSCSAAGMGVISGSVAGDLSALQDTPGWDEFSFLEWAER